jgi:hypothetical protein
VNGCPTIFQVAAVTILTILLVIDATLIVAILYGRLQRKRLQDEIVNERHAASWMGG